MQQRISAFIFTAILLFGCGGGDALNTELSNLNYPRAVYQPPNYHPHVSPSHAYFWDDTVYLGGDVAPKEKLRRVDSVGDITYFMGASRDGVGVNRLINYGWDLATMDNTVRPSIGGHGFYPFRIAPRLWVDNRFNQALARNDPIAQSTRRALDDSIQIINDALPPEFQINWGDSARGESPSHEGAIGIRYIPAENIGNVCGGAGAIACAQSNRISLGNLPGTNIPVGYTAGSEISIPDNFDPAQYGESRTIILHELLHALGIWGHVDSTEFPDSIMGTRGDFFPNPGFVIHRIDREALQIMYMEQLTAQYNDWGEWSDTSLHLMGESEDGHVNFGVVLFNGLPQPWARGTRPERNLSDANYLRGTVTWEGALLGFSGVAPVAGEAALTVDMNRLTEEQDLRFQDLFFVNRFESSGPDRWFPDRNIHYRVTMAEDGFYYSSATDHVSGLFMGPRHEGMAGTLKRTDLVGAFGGTR